MPGAVSWVRQTLATCERLLRHQQRSCPGGPRITLHGVIVLPLTSMVLARKADKLAALPLGACDDFPTGLQLLARNVRPEAKACFTGAVASGTIGPFHTLVPAVARTLAVLE